MKTALVSDPRASPGEAEPRRWSPPLVVGLAACVLAGAAIAALRTAAGLDLYVPLATCGRLGAAAPIVIRNVRLLSPPDWKPGEPVDVRVERGAIGSVSAAGAIDGSPGERVIDGGGRVMSGGLCDVEVASVFRTATRHPLPLDVYRISLSAQVRSGVTAVRDLGSPPAAGVRLARAVGGTVLGASIERGSPWITPGDPAPDALDPGAHPLEGLALHSPAEAEPLVAELAASGSRWLAISVPPDGLAQEDVRARLDALARAAHAHGLRLAVRALDPAAFDWALAVDAASIDGFAAFSADLTADEAERLAARRVTVVPVAHLARVRDIGSDGAYERDRQTRTIGRASLWGALARIDHQVRTAQLDPAAVVRARERNERWKSNLARLVAARVPVAMGSGAPAAFAFHERPADELEELALSGLTGGALLESAIENGARLLTGDDASATIAVGRAANLVVWECDPGADAACFERPRLVMAGGHVVDGRPTAPARPFL